MAENVERMLRAMTRLRRVGDLPILMTGLHRGEFAVLTILCDHADRDGPCCEDGMTASRLSREMDISPAAASQAISSLVAKGYVKRVPDVRDRRISRLSLTQRGAELACGTKEQLRALVAGVLGQLGPEKAECFVELFDTVSLMIAKEMRAIRAGETLCAAKNPGKENACESTSVT